MLNIVLYIVIFFFCTARFISSTWYATEHCLRAHMVTTLSVLIVLSAASNKVYNYFRIPTFLNYVKLVYHWCGMCIVCLMGGIWSFN